MPVRPGPLRPFFHLRTAQDATRIGRTTFFNSLPGVISARTREGTVFVKTLIAFIALGLSLSGAGAQPLRVFVSPNGDDKQDGLAMDRPIKSLAHAQEIIAHQLSREPNDAEVRIAPETFFGEIVKWTFSMPGHTITFLPASDRADRPIFYGDGTGTWFTFRGQADGVPTNLIFRRIRVQHYQSAISFSGNRRKTVSSSRGNTIDGCYFSHIGQDSTAAVRFVNSSGNRVVHCHFVSIVTRSDPYLLHAIYAAHGSSDTVILHNRFESCSGDPIRFRDGSNGNRVEGNLFLRTGVEGAVTDWFCDHDTESDCTKPTAECPSWNNRVKDNILDRTFAGGPLEATYVYSERIPSGCARPSADVKRFFVSGNRRP